MSTKKREKRNTGRRSPLARFLLFMLLGAVIGAVAGFFGYILFGSDATQERLWEFVESAGAAVRSAMLPLMTGLMIVSVIFGEWILKRFRQVTQKLAQAGDEESDRLEYRQERIGALGMVGTTVFPILSILLVSVCYSGNYLGSADAIMDRFFFTMIVFLILCIYTGIWQMRYVKVVQNSDPRFRNADLSSSKFPEQWLSCCDEAEREIIYRSAYKTYRMLAGKLLPVLMVVAMFSNLLFDTGLLAVVIAAVTWLAVIIFYNRYCISMKKLRAEV